MRKRTMRKLAPDAREIMQIANEAASTARRLKNLALRINDRKIEREVPGMKKN